MPMFSGLLIDASSSWQISQLIYLLLDVSVGELSNAKFKMQNAKCKIEENSRSHSLPHTFAFSILHFSFCITQQQTGGLTPPRSEDSGYFQPCASRTLI